MNPLAGRQNNLKLAHPDFEPARREFLRVCACACAAGALAYVGVGCANKGGNPSNSGPQIFTINLADYPQLANDYSAVSVGSTPLGHPILVTHTTGDTYYALDSTCTHAGCTVPATTPTLNCPCHGSRFTLTGAVATGPATRPLTSYPIHKEGNLLTIDLP